MRRRFLALLLGAIIILGYMLYRTEFQISIFRGLMSQVDRNQVGTMVDGRSRIWPIKGDTLSPTRMEWAEKDKEVKRILAKLDQLMPSVTFTDINTTTSAKNSKATILNRRSSYCVGDPLMVRLDLYDHLGKRKEYGGDFLRARIYSSGLKAGASGRITDYRNGTYLVNFTLFWAGDVRVSLLLIHPSEAVSALWAARKKGYDKIAFTGNFLNGTSDLFTECGFVINTNAELCEYLDERDQEAFYCVKPKNAPCEAFVRLKSDNKNVSYLMELEQSLLNSSNTGTEIPQTFRDIHVYFCERKKTMAMEKCRVGMTSPSPSGFVWQNHWHPVFCSVPSFNTFSTFKWIDICLKRKLIYLLGDSTVRQWMEYIASRVRSFKYLDTHGAGKHQNLIAVDMTKNIQIQWKKHGHPLVTIIEYMVRDHSYIAREIDNMAGDRDTTIVIAVGQHFRPFPIELFIQRMINIRGAIERLLLRSPDTKVIIKAENIREINIDQERFSDFHGYAQNLALKDVFRDMKVGFIDAWDMTAAYGTKILHPPENVVGNQINMFLTYIC